MKRTIVGVSMVVVVACAVGCDTRLPVGADAAVDHIDLPPPDARPTADARPTTRPPTTLQFVQGKQIKLDLLFVMDNSGSMGEEQQNLIKNVARLLDSLRTPLLGSDGTGKPCDANNLGGCKLPDIHVGVVSTDLGAGNYGLPSCERAGGDSGRMFNTPRIAGCTPPADAYITYNNGKTNIPGAGADAVQAVNDAFACIARLGTDGCGFESPLEAARLALQPATNPGFRRPDAQLAIVFITDEDDCSAQNPVLFDPTQQALSDPLGPLTSFRCFEFGVQCDVNDRNLLGPRFNCVPTSSWLFGVKRYTDAFRSAAGGQRLYVAVIGGPTDRVEVGRDGTNPVLKASCTSAAGNAVPGLRLKAVTDALAPSSQYTSICEQSFGPALVKLGNSLVTTQTAGCLPRVPLTTTGALTCAFGTKYSPTRACTQDCLHLANCSLVQTSGGNSQPIAQCPAQLWGPDSNCQAIGTCPCWRLVSKPNVCGVSGGTPYALDILRGGAPVPSDAIARLTCVLADADWGSQALSALPECR
ncbi:MAG: VWA domain-containing protein [Myxococcales bacterium]|nr:VWA domain-containing protein [Myxococcales bacterium]